MTNREKSFKELNEMNNRDLSHTIFLNCVKMTNLEYLKYILNAPENYDDCDIAIFLEELIVKTQCESFNDILRELLDNYNK